MYHGIIALGLVLTFTHLVSNCEDDEVVSEFLLKGDYTIGGLFSLHSSRASQGSYYTPAVESCSRLKVSLAGYRCFQVMRFAVDEINNSSTLLPNVTLGYNVFDTCYIYNNIQPALKFMSQDSVINTGKSYRDFIPSVISVIGPDNSDAMEATVNLFNLLSLPQINILATFRRMSASSLTSFFQTVPNSSVQQQTIIEILRYFKWTWITVLGSSDEYGIQGVQDFLKLISDMGICVAYTGFIPNKLLDKDTNWENSIHQIVTNIALTNVNVIVVFSTDIILLDFFKEVTDTDLPSKVWIATETWSLSKDIYDLPNMKTLGVVFGIALKYVKIPGFDEYLLKVYSQNKNKSGNLWEEQSCNQNCNGCLNFSLSSILGPLEKRASYSIYAAVYSVAHALHDVLACNNAYCNKTDIYPWQITEALREVNFSLLNKQISFDQNGDASTGYDIVFWNWSSGTPFETVGSYNGLGKLVINTDQIKWQTTNNTVPSSTCSPECLPGQKKQQKGPNNCCFICVSCTAGTYLHENDTCVGCNQDQWSTERSTFCNTKTRRFLTWKDTMTIPLFVVTILWMGMTFGVFVTFAVHLSSPVVKAAGGRMCFLMLTSLTVAYLSILAYLGEPSTIKCIVRYPIYSIALTICFSYVSIRSFQIVCIFKLASRLPATYDYWVKQNGQYICLAVLSGIQVLISCVWIIISPPTATTKEMSPDQVLVECSEFGSMYNILQYSYNALLSLVCFTFAYMGKELPKNYSEAKCITFSMLIYFVVCISFFTAQLIDVGEYGTAINAGLALFSLMGVTGGYFFPKCYIIFCRPQFNTTKHFQNTIQFYTKRGSGNAK